MHLPKERIAYLLEAYTSKKATSQEEQELMEYLHDAQDDADLKAYIENLWNSYQPGESVSTADWDGMFNRIIRSDKVYSIVEKTNNKNIIWRRIAVAAAIVLLLVSGSYLIRNPVDKNLSVLEEQQQLPVKDVMPPSTNKATLTLASGKIIVLDNAGNGSLSALGATNASRLNEGELSYTDTELPVVELHTLYVPKGSKPMHLQLSDGTGVWLNAASGITFPNVFTGNERTVTVTGESYFEVKHDAGRPFIVSKGDMQVRVLGTKFNVNAYDEDDDIRITLLEGSVKVFNGNKESLLKPGQQARLANGGIKVQNENNLQEVMAWKNGLFEFNDTDIQTIMKQIERWYDVDVVFDGAVNQHFNGTIQRQVNVSKVLHMLEKTGGIRFSIEGRKVIVKNY